MVSDAITLLKACKKKSKATTQELIDILDEYDLEMKKLNAQIMTLQTMVTTATIELYIRGREMKDE